MRKVRVTWAREIEDIIEHSSNMVAGELMEVHAASLES